jgi:hypothetical protein
MSASASSAHQVHRADSQIGRHPAGPQNQANGRVKTQPCTAVARLDLAFAFAAPSPRPWALGRSPFKGAQRATRNKDKEQGRMARCF